VLVAFFLDKLAEFHQIPWKLQRDQLLWVAESENFALAKPRTHLLKNNILALDKVFKRFRASYEDMTIIHHDWDVQIGVYLTGKGDLTKGNETINNINEFVETSAYQRIAIGVGSPEYERIGISFSSLSPTYQQIRSAAQYTKIPPEHMKVIEEGVFADIPSKLSKILSSVNKEESKRSDGKSILNRDYPLVDTPTEEEEIEQPWSFEENPYQRGRSREFLL